jgi:hypothetical protein
MLNELKGIVLIIKIIAQNLSTIYKQIIHNLFKQRIFAEETGWGLLHCYAYYTGQRIFAGYL